MNKIDLGIDKNEIRFLFETLHKQGKLNEDEYKKAIDRISTYEIKENN